MKLYLYAKTETAIKVTVYAADGFKLSNCKYRVNSGSWQNFMPGQTFTEEDIYISGLTAYTSYTVDVQAYESAGTAIALAEKTATFTTYDYPHCTSGLNFTLGEKNTLKFYNPLGRNFNFYMSVGGTRIPVDYQLNGGTSYTGMTASSTIDAIYARMTTSKSAKYTVTCTFNGHTKTSGSVGTVKCNDADCLPEIGTISYADTESSVTAITGSSSILVQSKSHPQFTVSGITTKKYATVQSVRVYLNGFYITLTKSGSNYVGTFTGSKAISADYSGCYVELTDSRGYVRKKNKGVTIREYQAPTLNVSAKRDQGYYANTTIQATAECSNVGSNVCGSISLSAKSGSTTITRTLTSGTAEIVSLDNTKVWTLTFTVSDSFGTETTVTIKVGKGVPIMFWDTDMNSVGIDMFPTHSNALDVAGDIYSAGNKVVTGTGTYVGMNSDTTAIDSNLTWHDLNMLNGGNLSLGAGRWLLIGQVEFPTASTGRCGIRWKNATASTAQASSTVIINRAGGVNQLQTIAFYAPDETREYCLQAFQNGGSQLTVTARCFAIRLRD